MLFSSHHRPWTFGVSLLFLTELLIEFRGFYVVLPEFIIPFQVGENGSWAECSSILVHSPIHPPLCLRRTVRSNQVPLQPDLVLRVFTCTAFAIWRSMWIFPLLGGMTSTWALQALNAGIEFLERIAKYAPESRRTWIWMRPPNENLERMSSNPFWIYVCRL